MTECIERGEGRLFGFRRRASAQTKPAWELEAEELAKQPNLRFIKHLENRQRVMEGLPEVAAYFGEDSLQPPDELTELDGIEEEPASPETHGLLEQIARFQLEDSQLVRLYHPKNGLGSQVYQHEGPLTISLVDNQEYIEDNRETRRRVRLVRDADGIFQHDDVVVFLESDPEYSDPIQQVKGPVSRMEMLSMLMLLSESSVEHREE